MRSIICPRRSVVFLTRPERRSNEKRPKPKRSSCLCAKPWTDRRTPAVNNRKSRESLHGNGLAHWQPRRAGGQEWLGGCRRAFRPELFGNFAAAGAEALAERGVGKKIEQLFADLDGVIFGSEQREDG